MNASLIELKVPPVGESVSEVEIGAWLKQVGDLVQVDESVAMLETDKATLEVRSPVSGTLAEVLKPRGSKVQPGEVLGRVQTGSSVAQPAVSAATPPSTPSTPVSPTAPRVMPAAARLMAEKGVSLDEVKATGPGGRVLKEDVQGVEPVAKPAETMPAQQSAPAGLPAVPATPLAAVEVDPNRAEEVVPMSLLRRKVAERLVAAQHQAALLTTFNEVDMSFVAALRKEHQERFVERYQVKLGFMSFFVKAVIEGLREFPQLNAEVRGANIVYRNFFDIGIAIGGGRGLVVPVLRNAERLSFAGIEQAIADFGKRVKENRIQPEDLQGGTFTITNGGVYGSLLSTPIVNAPQSGVLGMHAIQDRPVAVAGQVVIRPMMYVALTYDHRIVDGREGVSFLKRVKELVENPVRLLIEI